MPKVTSTKTAARKRKSRSDDKSGDEDARGSHTAVTPKLKRKKKAAKKGNKKKRANENLDLTLLAESDEYLSKLTDDPDHLKNLIRNMAMQMEHDRSTLAMKAHISRPGAMRYHAKRNIGKTDPQAQEAVSAYANGLYSTQKFLDSNWEEWSRNKFSTCQTLKCVMTRKSGMRKPPRGLSWPEYWMTKLRYALNYKMGQIMNQKLQKMRKAFKGESYFFRAFYFCM